MSGNPRSLPFPFSSLPSLDQQCRFAPLHPPPLSTDAILALIRQGLDEATFPAKQQPLRVLILVEDASRPTQTALPLSLLLTELRPRLPLGSQVSILVAGGAHYGLDNSWKIPEDSGWDDLLFHHPRAAKLVGEIDGVPLWLNPAVIDADLRIAVGTVNLHFKAGFSGGSKIFLPGAAGLPTIFAFHELKNGAAGQTSTPLRKMADQVLAKFPVAFALQFLSDITGRITGLHTGPLPHAWYTATQALLPRVSFQLSSQYPLCLAEALPFEKNLLGFFKALSPVLTVLQPGGTGVIFLPAPEGLGAHLWRLDPDVRAKERADWERTIGDREVIVLTESPLPAAHESQIFPEQVRLLPPTAWRCPDMPLCLLEGAPLLRITH